MSTRTKILMEASQNVNLEASTNSLADLMEAAANVAETQNLPSPLRESRPGMVEKQPLHATYSEGITPKKINSSSPTRPGRDASKAKTVKIVSDKTDVDALTNKLKQITRENAMSDGSGMRRSGGFEPSKPKSAYGGRRSLEAMGGGSSYSQQSSPGRQRRFSGPNNMRRSQVSVFLDESRGQPWEAKLESVFASKSQEVLFRSMRTIPTKKAQAKARARSVGTIRTEDKEGAMSEDDGNAEKKEKKTFRKKLDQNFASLDDAKECAQNFQPKIYKRKSGGETGEDKAAPFLDRQEMKEASRQRKMKQNIDQNEYAAVVDKKFCPTCGATQKHDEVKEKRMFCPNCNEKYRSKVAWGQVSKAFFEKQKNEAEKKWLNLEKINLEILKDKHTRIDRTGPKVKLVLDEEALEKAISEREAPKTIYPEEQEEFFQRMEEQMVKKEEVLKKLDQKIMEEQYPFKPQIPKKDDDEDDEDNNFMARWEKSCEKKNRLGRKKRAEFEEKEDGKMLPWKPPTPSSSS